MVPEIRFADNSIQFAYAASFYDNPKKSGSVIFLKGTGITGQPGLRTQSLFQQSVARALCIQGEGTEYLWSRG